MKPSEAMLKGFEMAGERQCFGPIYEGAPQKPSAVCAEGAIALGEHGNASTWRFDDLGIKAHHIWREKFGVGMYEDADAGMSIPDIAGILAAEGY